MLKTVTEHFKKYTAVIWPAPVSVRTPDSLFSFLMGSARREPLLSDDVIACIVRGGYDAFALAPLRLSERERTRQEVETPLHKSVVVATKHNREVLLKLKDGHSEHELFRACMQMVVGVQEGHSRYAQLSYASRLRQLAEEYVHRDKFV